MKNFIPILAALLFTLSTTANNDNDNLSMQYVSFEEAGVFFEVFLDGSFTFTLPHNMEYSYHGQRSRSGRGGKVDNLSIHYSNHRNTPAEYILIDHSGILYAIGDTRLQYNENGQLKRVGPVQLSYTDGRLVQIGGLDIHYDHLGGLSHTNGNINYSSANSSARAVKLQSTSSDITRARRNRKARYTGWGVVNFN